MTASEAVLIFGSNGFLGSYVADTYSQSRQVYECFRDAKGDLKLKRNDQKVKIYPYSLDSFKQIILELSPRLVFNSIAMIDFKLCEQNPDLAFYINSSIPKKIAQATNLSGSKLIQFSTDAVFGQIGKDFTENDTPIPKSVYGISKLNGEKNVSFYNPNSLIVRTNFVGFHKTRNTLFNYFYQNFKSNTKCEGFSDVKFNPIYIKDLVNATKSISESETKGIIHICANETISKYDYGLKILNQLKLPRNLLSIRKIGADNFNGLMKQDLTLTSNFRDKLYACLYDVDLGIKDSLMIASEENYVI